MFKRSVALIVAVVLMLPMAGCGKSDDDSSSGKSRAEEQNVSSKSIYEHGMELVELIHIEASDEGYIELMAEGYGERAKEHFEIISENDYSKPKAVYAVSLETDELHEKINEKITQEKIYKQIETSLNGTIVSSCLAKYGSESLMASSCFRASKSFISKKIKEDTRYIYCYEDSYPVMVIFGVNNEYNIVGASASVLTAPDLIGADSERDFRDFFGEIDYDFEEIELEK